MDPVFVIIGNIKHDICLGIQVEMFEKCETCDVGIQWEDGTCWNGGFYENWYLWQDHKPEFQHWKGNLVYSWQLHLWHYTKWYKVSIHTPVCKDDFKTSNTMPTASQNNKIFATSL